MKKIRRWLGAGVHKALCPVHGVVAHPIASMIVKLRTRTPKHRNVYYHLYSTGMTVFMFFTAWLALHGLGDLVQANLVHHISDLVGWLVVVPLFFSYTIAVYWIFHMFCRRHSRMVVAIMEERDIDMLGMEDLGEDIEGLGTPWRRVKFMFAYTVGKGRIADYSVQHAIFAFNPETHETRVVECSHPELKIIAEMHMQRQS